MIPKPTDYDIRQSILSGKVFPVLAFDVSVSPKVIELLEQKFEVAYRAHEAEEDLTWVNEALERGANVFISSDIDINTLLSDLAPWTVWIDVPQRLSGKSLYHFVVKRLGGK